MSGSRALFYLQTILFAATAALAAGPAAALDSPDELASKTTIHRDEWGVPHIDGPTDACVIFGYGYCQAEDYLWQVEENILRAIGRFSEAVGPEGLDSDLLNHRFGIPTRSREDYPKLSASDQTACEAFAAGINYCLSKNPHLKPRVLKQYEPWHIFAHRRQIGLDWMFSKANVDKGLHRKLADAMELPPNSNGWALAPWRSQSGSALLFINPHQPWYGHGQFYEGHLRSGEGLNFSGSSFYGNPFPSMGHNEHLGWGHTANQPDVADAYRLEFDDPKQPLSYRVGKERRLAAERVETILVRQNDGSLKARKFRFLDTDHGPVVSKESPTTMLTVRIAKMDEVYAFDQGLRMAKAQNYADWRKALAELNLPMFNCIYADKAGRIAYIYNGAVPLRDRSFDWSKPVDASDPRTVWKGYHALDDLPQVVDPPSGFVQNCNQTPFTTTDDGNPFALDFPPYIVGEKDSDLRRAKVSRMLLRKMQGVTFEDWQSATLDTTLYWPLVEVPQYMTRWNTLKQTDPELAAKVQPYLEHLADWDYRGTVDSTQTTLCVAWYMELYGVRYPAETLLPQYVDDAKARFKALAAAAGKLQLLFGDWKVPWGKVSRIQRIAEVSEGPKAPFSDKMPSVPSPGLPGPLGVAFNTYYTLPTPARRQQYGYAGNSFVAVIEFGKEKPRAKSVLQFGVSGDPKSPHFFDQAQLVSQRRYKDAWFDWQDVVAHTKSKYHPGESRRSTSDAVGQ